MSKNKHNIPSNGEFGQLRAFLARNSVSQTRIDEAIGIVPNGRSRLEITEQLRTWLKTLT